MVTSERTPPTVPWRAGLVTGIGSMPGTDPSAAAQLVAGELSEFPHLVELPDRGPAADMIGRALAICVDFPSELTSTGWRLASAVGRDRTRATDFLSWDLDAAQQQYRGADWIKIQVAGPWSLAASTELPRGQRVLTDTGATRDLIQSLTEGVIAQAVEVAARLPGPRVLIQLDEPALPAVLAGALPTASGWDTVAAVPSAAAGQVLTDMVAALRPHPVVLHCCDPALPLDLGLCAGFAAVSMDVSAEMTSSVQRLDQIGELIDRGLGLFAGVVDPRADLLAMSHHEVIGPLRQLWARLGFPQAQLRQVTATPTCGLAGCSPQQVRRVFELLQDVSLRLEEAAHSD